MVPWRWVVQVELEVDVGRGQPFGYEPDDYT